MTYPVEQLPILASLAARTVVSAAATDAWGTCKLTFARLLGRGDAQKTDRAQRQLEDTRQQLIATADSELERTRAVLALQWQSRFADLLDENPGVEAETRAAVQEISALLPPAIASASDHSIAAGRDVTVNADRGPIAAGIIHGGVAAPWSPDLGSKADHDGPDDGSSDYEPDGVPCEDEADDDIAEDDGYCGETDDEPFGYAADDGPYDVEADDLARYYTDDRGGNASEQGQQKASQVIEDELALARIELARALARRKAADKANMTVGRSLAPVEPPVPQRLAIYDDLVREAFADLVKPGRLLFNPPDQMQLGRTERIEVRLTRTLKLDAELMEHLRGRGEPQMEPIPTAPLMAVTLKGDAFHVTALSDEQQSVTRDEITTWEFDIRALRHGPQRLIVCVSLRIPVSGHSPEHKSIPVREAVIDVQVGAPDLVAHFVSSNWQWFVGTAVAIAGVLVAILIH